MGAQREFFFSLRAASCRRLANAYAGAIWSRDGAWIYFRSDRSGSQQIWKMPSSAPYQPAVPVTRNGGFEPVESMDGKLVYYTKANGGLWVAPVAGGEETPLYQPARRGLWEVAENGIYFVDVQRRSADGLPIEWFNFATRKTVPVGMIPQVAPDNAPNFAVTRDGRRIAWVQLDHQDSDLMLIENFR